jgi:hypothetical protein
VDTYVDVALMFALVVTLTILALALTVSRLVLG